MEKGSGLLATYPEAMRIFQNTYLSERDIDDKTAYIFFFDQYGAGGAKDRNADGFMPRGKQFGYMFTKGFSGNDIYIAAAHELGHGKFLLKHPFDKDYKIPVSSTDNLMDYTAGAIHIAKWQWDLIHDPGVVVRVFERDEDAERVILSIVDQDDLKKYNELISELKKLNLFNSIYEYLDNSSQYVSVQSLKVNHKNYVEIMNKYKNTNGYFLDSKKPNGGLFGFFMNQPGEEDNPHIIVLFSSKNYTIKDISGKQLFSGNGFRSASTIFEEFFHAAHYLYLIEHNKYFEDTFFTQTEIEVEIAQALAYYIMKSDDNYKNIITPKFDGYEFIRKTGFDEVDTEKAKFFEAILNEKQLSQETLEKYMIQINSLIETKSKSYRSIDINKLDKKFDFIKYIINNAYN
jgi:hypothetical protein